MTLFFRLENLILANPFPNDQSLDWAKLKTTNSDFMKMAEYSSNGQETLREKEKLLVTSNFSFSHSVFYPLGELTSIFIKFKIDKQWEKEKLLVMSNFSFIHSVFYPFGEVSSIFIKFEIVIYKPFQFERV